MDLNSLARTLAERLIDWQMATAKFLTSNSGTREKCDMCSQPLDAQVEFLNRELANFRRNAAFAAESTRWISVEEKLPDGFDKLLLVHVDLAAAEQLRNLRQLVSTAGWKEFDVWNGDAVRTWAGKCVTHWSRIEAIQPEVGLGESREPLHGDVPKSSNETRN